MLMNNQEPSSSNTHEEELIREIHALTPPSPPTPPPSIIPSRRFSNLSTATNATDNFTTMSHEFNALLLAASPDRNDRESNDVVDDLEMIEEETNPLAIVTDDYSQRDQPPENAAVNERRRGEVVSVQKVKEDEVEAKIVAWQNAKVAKVNNRFKREDGVINGWENEQVHMANSWMNKVERKLEEKRAKAMEKMQNEIAKAQRKAEERRATSEAKRGTKIASILEVAKFMRAVGKPPSQRRSFF